MRNLKKIVALVVTLAILLGVAGIMATAEETAPKLPTLALSGSPSTSTTDTENGGFYELAVYITDGGDSYGAIEGKITYNTSYFNYAGIVLNKNFKNAGNPVDSVVSVDAVNGIIDFVGIYDATTANGEWFVLKFTTTGATGETNFGIAAAGANTTEKFAVNVSTDRAVTNIKDAATNDIFRLEGAGIKSAEIDEQDIRYRVYFDNGKFAAQYQNYDVVEYGVMMMFTRRLNYRDLEYSMIENNEPGLAVAKIVAEEGSTITMPDKFYANLNGVTSNIVGIKITARAYAKIVAKDDAENIKYIYSENNDEDCETASGYASKSVLNVGKKTLKKLLDLNVIDDETDKTYAENITALESISNQGDRNRLFSLVKVYYEKAKANGGV